MPDQWRWENMLQGRRNVSDGGTLGSVIRTLHSSINVTSCSWDTSNESPIDKHTMASLLGGSDVLCVCNRPFSGLSLKQSC